MCKLINKLFWCFLTVIFFSTVLTNMRSFAAPASIQPRAGSTGVQGYRNSEFTGNSSYEIPLQVPAGINGFQPQLVLQYSTNTSLSWLGQGWDLSLGRVTRSARVNPITFTNADTFVLQLGSEGLYDELHPTGGSSYATLYKKRNLKITKNGETGWTVKNGSGVTYEFNKQDKGTGTSEVWAWHLSRITEAHGNRIDITYTQDSGFYYISRITYTGRTITFNLTNKNLERYPKYYKRGKSQLKKAITSIQMAPSNTRYEFHYIQPTGLQHVVLDWVDRVGSDGQRNRIALMTYQNGSNTVRFQNYRNFNGSVPFGAIENHPYVRLTEINGDGIPDVLFNQLRGVMLYHLGTGSGWGNRVERFISGGAETWGFQFPYVQLADINGDDYIDSVRSLEVSNWQFALGNGDGWDAAVFHGRALPTNCMLGWWCFLLDVNGDRRDDIFYNPPDNNRFSSGFAPSNGNGWDDYQGTTSVSLPDPFRFSLHNLFTRPIDFNRDGIIDFVYLRIDDSLNIKEGAFVLGNGKASVDTTVYNIQFPSNMTDIFSFSRSGLRVVDLNNDGYLDLIANENIPGNPWQRRYKYSLGQPVSGNAYRFNSVGDLGIQFGIFAANDHANSTFDFNNDGQIDLFQEGNANSGFPAKYMINQTLPYFIPGILLSAKDDWGKTTTFTYGNSFEATGTSVPYRFPILNQVEERDGYSPNRRFTYTYDTPQYSHSEREFQGFGHVLETDLGNIRKDTYFLQDRPRLGFMDRLQKSNGLTITNTYSNNATKPYDNILQSTRQQESGKIVTTSFTYDSYGNATQEVASPNSGDPNMTTQRRFDANTSAWLVTFPYEVTVSMGSSSRTDKFFYDSGRSRRPSNRGDLTRIARFLNTRGYDLNQDFTYDGYGNRLTDKDPRGNTISFTYDNTYHSFLTRKDYPLSLSETFSNWTSGGGFGQIRSKTSFNGHTTNYAYDGFGRLSRVTGPNDGGSTYGSVSHAYNLGQPGNNFIETRKTEEYGTSQVYYSKELKDGFRQTVRQTSDGEGGNIVTQKTYDYRGNMLTSTFPGFGGPGSTIRHEYDLLDRVTRITSPDGGNVRYGYTGWTTRVTDENNHWRDITYDVRNRIKRAVERNGGASYTTNYQYNIFDVLTRMTDHHGNTWTYGYDTTGRKTSENDPDLGTISYSYDDNDNLTQRTYANGKLINYTYDALNRMMTKDHSDTQGVDATYRYDENDVSNGRGQRTRMTDPSGETRFHYDNEGRTIQEVHDVLGLEDLLNVQWVYDAMDRTKILTYPNNQTVTFTYNNQGLTESVSNFVSNVDYTALGQERRISFANGLTTNLSYRSDNQRLARIQAGSYQDQNYSYDLVGNITRIYDSANSWDKSYGYDDLNRLRSGDGQSYGYNPIGNLTLKNGQAQQYGSRQPHALTHDGVYSYIYDAVGNMTSGNDRTITYDAENRPIYVERTDSTTEFIYDGDGQRKIKIVDDVSSLTTTVYIKDLFEKVI